MERNEFMESWDCPTRPFQLFWVHFISILFISFQQHTLRRPFHFLWILSLNPYRATWVSSLIFCRLFLFFFQFCFPRFFHLSIQPVQKALTTWDFHESMKFSVVTYSNLIFGILNSLVYISRSFWRLEPGVSPNSPPWWSDPIASGTILIPPLFAFWFEQSTI